jgi:hypothetical protein
VSVGPRNDYQGMTTAVGATPPAPRRSPQRQAILAALAATEPAGLTPGELARPERPSPQSPRDANAVRVLLFKMVRAGEVRRDAATGRYRPARQAPYPHPAITAPAAVTGPGPRAAPLPPRGCHFLGHRGRGLDYLASPDADAWTCGVCYPRPEVNTTG